MVGSWKGKKDVHHRELATPTADEASDAEFE